jgi:hypothetical protein
MAIVQNTPLGPGEIRRLTTAYELALKGLSLKDRSDPLHATHRQKVFEIGQTDIEDPAQISMLAIRPQ